jgi:hypothetical protein
MNTERGKQPRVNIDVLHGDREPCRHFQALHLMGGIVSPFSLDISVSKRWARHWNDDKLVSRFPPRVRNDGSGVPQRAPGPVDKAATYTGGMSTVIGLRECSRWQRFDRHQSGSARRQPPAIQLLGVDVEMRSNSRPW